MNHDYKKLNVYQESLDLVSNIYLVTASFPKEEIYGLTSQIRRSAVSIPSNISEGCGRTTTKEFQRYLDIARGSSNELETQITISVRLNFLEKNLAKKLFKNIEVIQKMLFKLKQSMQQF